MKATVTTIVGDTHYTFHIEEKDDKETLLVAIVLGNPPKECNECQNTEIFVLDGNKDKEGNVYINTLCKKCGAKAKLGSYKAGGYFWHDFVKYVSGGSKEQSTQSVVGNQEPPPEDLPF